MTMSNRDKLVLLAALIVLLTTVSFVVAGNIGDLLGDH